MCTHLCINTDIVHARYVYYIHSISIYELNDVHRRVYRCEVNFDTHLTKLIVNVQHIAVSVQGEVERSVGAMSLMVGRSYVGNDVTHSTLLDRAKIFTNIA